MNSSPEPSSLKFKTSYISIIILITTIAYFNSLKKFLDADYAKKLTFEILDQLKPLKVIGWREKESVLKEMRVKVKDILFQKKIEIKDAQKIAITIIDLTRMHPDE